MVEIIDYAVDILKRRGYLSDDDLRPGLRSQRITAAVDKYRAENPYVPPLYPSIEYPGEEARCRDCLDGGYIARVHHDGLHTQTEYLVCRCRPLLGLATAYKVLGLYVQPVVVYSCDVPPI